MRTVRQISTPALTQLLLCQGWEQVCWKMKPQLVCLWEQSNRDYMGFGPVGILGAQNHAVQNIFPLFSRFVSTITLLNSLRSVYSFPLLKKTTGIPSLSSFLQYLWSLFLLAQLKLIVILSFSKCSLPSEWRQCTPAISVTGCCLTYCFCHISVLTQCPCFPSWALSPRFIHITECSPRIATVSPDGSRAVQTLQHYHKG